MQAKKRNLGKKLMAAMLSAAMLVGSCTGAFAQEAADVTTKSVRLSDLRIVSGEQVIDLTGVSLEVDVTGTEKPEALSLHLDVNDEEVAEIGFTGTDTLAVLHLESPTLGAKDYVLDASVLLSRYMDEGIQSLVTMLQGIDTKAVADSILKSANEADALPDMPETEAAEPETELVIEDMPEVTVDGDIASVIESCITGPEPVELGGVQTGINGEEISIAEGSYEKTNFSFGVDELSQILDMIYVDGEASGLSEQLRAEVSELEVSGSVTKGTAEGLNRLADINVKFDDGKGDAGEVHVAANKGFGENGEHSDAAVVVTNKGTTYGVSLSSEEGLHEGEAFTMDTVDMDSAIVLTDMDDAAVGEELGNAFSTFGVDVMGAALAPVLAAFMDTGMAEAQTEAVAE